MQGDLTVFAGPARAGKSAALRDALGRYRSALLFAPAVDGRDAAAPDEVPVRAVDRSHRGVAEIVRAARRERPHAVAVDGAQFFGDALVTAVQQLARHGFDVLAAGLHRDFRHEPFEPVSTLLDIADRSTVLDAECSSCGRRATRSQRFVDGEPAAWSDPQVDPDAVHEPRCAACHVVRA